VLTASSFIPPAVLLYSTDARFAGRTIYRNDVIDRSYNSTYGGFGASGSGMPRHRYGPASLDLGFNPVNPKPPIGEGGGSGIIPRMKEHLAGNYGVVMFYCMTSRAYTINKHGDNYFGPNQARLESHLSNMTQILFNQNTVYIGQDYDGDVNAGLEK